MKLHDGDDTAINSKKDRRQSRTSAISATSQVTAADSLPEKGALLPQQPKEVQVKGVRSCRECWATVS